MAQEETVELKKALVKMVKVPKKELKLGMEVYYSVAARPLEAFGPFTVIDKNGSFVLYRPKRYKYDRDEYTPVDTLNYTAVFWKMKGA